MRWDGQENQLRFNHKRRHFGLRSIRSGCPLSDLLVFTRTCCGPVESRTMERRVLSWAGAGLLAGPHCEGPSLWERLPPQQSASLRLGTGASSK